MDYTDFPQNKYSKWYINLIESRKFQPKEKFKTESHHIFPVSIFGKNKLTVNLKHKEHFIAHMLLWKMYQCAYSKESILTVKMNKAIRSFDTITGRYDGIDEKIRLTSRLFEKVREEFRVNSSQQTKEMWEDPEIRGYLTKCRQEYWANTSSREQQSVRRKEWFDDEVNLERQTEINREITSRPEWKEQRRNKQKEFSSDPEYTKKRIDAMSSPESKAKAKESFKKNVALMTDDERQQRFNTSGDLIWICNGKDKAIRIHKYDVIPEGYHRGRK
jgi:hypothetical protein